MTLSTFYTFTLDLLAGTKEPMNDGLSFLCFSFFFFKKVGELESVVNVFI